jgi:drug/metabolite transporter (DMT)-like permease
VRIPLPHGRALIGTVLYGLTAFAGAYAALYWGLVEAPAGTVQVLIATVPLVTLVMAVALRQERFALRGLVGALVALSGIAVIVGNSSERRSRWPRSSRSSSVSASSRSVT